ncbi:MAG: hypothetical protein ACHREM_08340 [Polyangiales bacterium]
MRLPLFVAAIVTACGCSSGGTAGLEQVASIQQAVTTYGAWADYGDGECVIGAQAFYKAKFSVTLAATGLQSGNVGACEYLGACMFWVSPKVEPDASAWDRHDWGTEMPKLYDLVIYPPHGTNPYGHVASVDHMEGTDATSFANLYVMDSNATVSEKKSPTIHTNGWQPYGFYRLKTQVGPFCTPGWEGALNCGDEPGVHDGDKNALYACSGITATLSTTCAAGCVHSATGKDDVCATTDAGAADAHGDVIDHEGGTPSDASDGGTNDVDAGANEAATDAVGDTATATSNTGGGCTVNASRSSSSDNAGLVAIALAAVVARRRRDR